MPCKEKKKCFMELHKAKRLNLDVSYEGGKIIKSNSSSDYRS